MKQNEALKWNPTFKWTRDEKVEAFDRLYAMALNNVHEIQQEVADGNYCDDRDDKSYIYEEVVGLLGSDVWEVVKALIG